MEQLETRTGTWTPPCWAYPRPALRWWPLVVTVPDCRSWGYVATLEPGYDQPGDSGREGKWQLEVLKRPLRKATLP
jgi:hypothetical protein